MGRPHVICFELGEYMNNASKCPHSGRTSAGSEFNRCGPRHPLTFVVRDGPAMQTQSQTDLPLRIPERKQDQP